MDRRHWISSFLIVALVALTLFLIRSTGAEEAYGDLGHSLNEMTLLQGSVPDHDAMSMQPTLIVAWNTRCPSCVHELRHLRDNYDKLKDDLNLVAVNLTETERRLEDVEQFLAEEDLPFTVLADERGEIAEHFNFRFIPANFLVDTDGELRKSQEGLIEVQTLRSWLE